MKKMWDPTKAVQQNLSDFGLAFDANAAIKCKSTKAELVARAKASDGNPWKAIEERKLQKVKNKLSFKKKIERHLRGGGISFSLDQQMCFCEAILYHSRAK